MGSTHITSPQLEFDEFILKLRSRIDVATGSVNKLLKPQKTFRVSLGD
jgi:hypothetical protein